MRLILASSSENRRGLFDMVGFDYEVITSKEAEHSDQTNPCEFVKELSLIKAESVEKQIIEPAIIVACDSVIYKDDKIYEKPKTKEEAKNNLEEMSGNTVYSVTGLTIKDLYKNKTITVSDTCKITFKKISEEEIKWYIENEKSFDFKKKKMYICKCNSGSVDQVLGHSCVSREMVGTAPIPAASFFFFEILRLKNLIKKLF